MRRVIGLLAMVSITWTLSAQAPEPNQEPPARTEGRIKELKAWPVIPAAPGPDLATLVFVRTRMFAGSALDNYCFAADQLLAVVPSGTMSWAYLHEGRQRICIWDKRDSSWGRGVYDVDVVGGETYYFAPWDGPFPVPFEIAEGIVKSGVDLYVPPRKVLDKAAAFAAAQKAVIEERLESSRDGIHFHLPVCPSPEAPAITSRPIKVPRRTGLLLENREPIAIDRFNPGSKVALFVAEDLVVDGRKVLAQGAPVEGVVTLAAHRGSSGRGGAIQITVPYLIDGVGRRIPIWSFVAFAGREHNSAGSIAAIVLLTFGKQIVRGDEVQILEHSRFKVFFAEDSWIVP